MFCSKCGKENNDNAEFCFSCGSRLNQLANETKNTTANSENNQNIPIRNLILLTFILSLIAFSITVFASLTLGAMFSFATIGIGYMSIKKIRKYQVTGISVVIIGLILCGISLIISGLYFVMPK